MKKFLSLIVGLLMVLAVHGQRASRSSVLVGSDSTARPPEGYYGLSAVNGNFYMKGRTGGAIRLLKTTDDLSDFVTAAGGTTFTGPLYTRNLFGFENQEDIYGEKERINISAIGSGAGGNTSLSFDRQYYTSFTGWVFGGNLLTLKNGYLGVGGVTNPAYHLDLGSTASFRYANGVVNGGFLKSNAVGLASWAAITTSDISGIGNYATVNNAALTGAVSISSSGSLNVNADASSTEYQRFKWYVYNPVGSSGVGASSKYVLQTSRRSGTISILNPIVVDNGKVGIGISDLDNEPSKTLTVGGDMKLMNQFFVNTSLYNYSEGNFLRVGSGGGIEGYNLFSGNNGFSGANTFTGNNNFTGANTFTGSATFTGTDKIFFSSRNFANTGTNIFNVNQYNDLFTIENSFVSDIPGPPTNYNNVFNIKQNRVGIGEVNPTANFEVSGTSKFNGSITATSIQASGAVSGLSFSSTTGASFATSSGNVGIGGTATAKLHVFGTALISSTLGVGGDLSMTGSYPAISMFGSQSGAINYRIHNFISGVGNTGFEVYDQTNARSRLVIDASGRVGIGNNSPVGALDVASTTGALIVPRMTAAQRTALTGVNGSIVYQTDGTAGFYFYDNGSWVKK